MKQSHKHLSGGFTLAEIMIVVGILTIVVLVAIPNMLRARMNSNEATAIETLRSIGHAQRAYFNQHQRYGTIEEIYHADNETPLQHFLGNWREDKVYSGYRFKITKADATGFTCVAAPTLLGGRRYFRVDASGIIRYNYEEAPSAEDPGIGT